MANTGLIGPIELGIAADASMMLVIRLTTAGVIARAGLTVDAMDNLKIAAEEACNCLIGQNNPPARLLLRFACEDRQLKISVKACEPETSTGEADETELEIVKCILESLVDHAAFEIQDGWIQRIELQKALD